MSWCIGILAGLGGLTALGLGLAEQYREWKRLRSMAAEVAAREGR